MSAKSDELGRALSHALRHEPWLYNLKPDDEGWTSVDALISALRRMGSQWGELALSDIVSVTEQSKKRRYELNGRRIRALYGHSLRCKVIREPSPPPSLLFHGTSPQAAEAILRTGLKPMTRQHVHLSVELVMAGQVGRRKSTSPVVLKIDGAGAHAAGVLFYAGNDKVWLTDLVPPRFIELVNSLAGVPNSATTRGHF